MAAATSVRITQAQQQFQGAFSEMWAVTCVIDTGSVGNNEVTTDSVAVPNVCAGDVAICWGWSADRLGLLDIIHVNADNSLDVHTHNSTGGIVDPGSMTLKVLVGRPAW